MKKAFVKWVTDNGIGPWNCTKFMFDNLQKAFEAGYCAAEKQAKAETKRGKHA